MKVIATIVLVVIVALPAIFAGWPGAEPAFFDGRVGGIPVSVIFMSVLMAILAPIAGWCSRAARLGDEGLGDGETGAE